MTDAEGYMIIARAAISFARFPHELRDWWRDEAENRKAYGLSQEQVDALAQLCRVKIADIAEDAEPHAVI